MSKKKQYKDSLADEAQRWINDYDNQEGGTLFDWNKQTIE